MCDRNTTTRTDGTVQDVREGESGRRKQAEDVDRD
jgi:hypothetical protein